MVSQLSLDCEMCVGPENLGNKDGGSSVPSSLEDHAAPQMPVKKVTRQWAAWTRQEEESFFAALRQVGKNFEKITCRVQSKNKDQVRHYYYRLVRRMNKLLGPKLCLDAKNSKDTNAAMLRWWSLLEKYSCKASKLHLKPRRFKIFVETLENQLMKDRKKNIRKRLSTGENNSSTTQIPAPNQINASGRDNNAVKVVLVERQNMQKVGNGKGSLLKRHINMGINCNNSEEDPSSTRTAKHRRKTGIVSTAAYKRWETAAIAGVSLVADAAEYLERVDTDNEIEHVQETPAYVGTALHSSSISPQRTSNDHNIHNSTKLKLQLFPIDECTRKALVMDHHNPHLELTLSTRKKISSVLEHLNRKWGNSNLLTQELMLFPYWAQRENMVGYQKWTKDSPLCAADVYYLIGSPPVFRLRYGWFSKAELESATAPELICINLNEKKSNSGIMEERNAETENPSDPRTDQFVSEQQVATLTPSSTCAPIKTIECGGSLSNVNMYNYHDSPVVVSSIRKDPGALATTRQIENMGDMGLSAGEWADSLTNISVGDLLSESECNTDVNSTDFPVPVGCNSLQQIPFSCDSFDAAIAAHVHKHQSKADLQQSVASSGPFIWDAEETCDAFQFQKNGTFYGKGLSASRNNSLEACRQTPTTNSFSSHKEDKELLEEKSKHVNMMDDSGHSSENSMRDFGGLADIYWADSLGQLDLDIPSRRYNSADLILSDSLDGLNRLIANSLDAFQSCSFFGLDKKEPSSTAEAHQTGSILDFKISSKV